ncbi:uncharacterized protein [Watersipora subatra]|uniref:uncharacterized protein n=1 Tax=Watersipora subatra TaxID=2589382 RepID=UPI00355B8DC4
MDSDKWTIDKLDSQNYQTWKFQMKHILLVKVLYDIVDGAAKAPEGSADQALKFDFKSRYRKAFSVIALSVSTELLYLITDTEAPDVAWKRLQNHFERENDNGCVCNEFTFITHHSNTFSLHSSSPRLIDSGASCHMTPNRESFNSYKKLEQIEMVSLNGGRTVEAVGVGVVKVMLKLNCRVQCAAAFYNVLHVPQLASNLFSVQAATQKGYIVQFGHTRCWINNASGRVRAMGSLANKLFSLDCVQTETQYANTASAEIWHQRLVHVNNSTLKN